MMESRCKRRYRGLSRWGQRAEGHEVDIHRCTSKDMRDTFPRGIPNISPVSCKLYDTSSKVEAVVLSFSDASEIIAYFRKMYSIRHLFSADNFRRARFNCVPKDEKILLSEIRKEFINYLSQRNFSQTAEIWTLNSLARKGTLSGIRAAAAIARAG